MLYVRLDSNRIPDEDPISLKELKKRFPKTVFPAQLTEDILDDIGYAFVPEAVPPARKEGHATVPDIPVLNDIGDVVRTFKYVPYAEAGGLEKRMDELRVKRDAFLEASDWTQNDDVQASMTALERQAWADYRAALRNMPEDFSDPNIVIYPVLPDKPKLAPVDTRSVRTTVKRKIAAKRIDVQHAGMTYVFPDGTSGTVQTRNTVDITNIISLAVFAMTMNITGQDSELLSFRDEENITHELTHLQMLTMAMQAMAFVSATYEKKWALEQQFDVLAESGASEETLMAFNIDEGWA